jgi:hypothetical protein
LFPTFVPQHRRRRLSGRRLARRVVVHGRSASS